MKKTERENTFDLIKVLFSMKNFLCVSRKCHKNTFFSFYPHSRLLFCADAKKISFLLIFTFLYITHKSEKKKYKETKTNSCSHSCILFRILLYFHHFYTKLKMKSLSAPRIVAFYIFYFLLTNENV
jgi:hypothetical protein